MKVQSRLVEERERTCTKCGKVLASRQALLNHHNKVFLCDRKGERRQKKPRNITSNVHQCKKCGKTLSSAAGLRYHKAKVTPCVPIQLTSGQITTIKKTEDIKTTRCKCHGRCTCLQNQRLILSQTTLMRETGKVRLECCPKCRKKFSTLLGLKVHMDRRSCGVDKHSLLKEIQTKATKKLDLFTKAKTKGSLVKTIANQVGEVAKPNKAHGLVTFHEQSLVTEQRHSDSETSTALNSRSFKRKRLADDGREDMSPVGEVDKRVRCDTGSFTELAARTLKRNSSPNNSNAKASDEDGDSSNSPLESEKSKHGGNILTDGCCCRKCVRAWTCKMARCMKCLSDEVESLRQQIATIHRVPEVGSQFSTLKSTESRAVVKRELSSINSVESATTKSDSRKSTQALTSQPPLISGNELLNAEPAKKFKPECTTKPTSTDKAPPTSPANDTVKIELTDKYNHLNDQVITNERALQDSIVYLEKLPKQDESNVLELRTQLDELRVYIEVEKSKRDEAVAAIIGHRWNVKRHEFHQSCLSRVNLALKKLFTRNVPTLLLSWRRRTKNFCSLMRKFKQWGAPWEKMTAS